MAICPECNGTRTIKQTIPTSTTTMDEVAVPCPFCEGTGQVYEDYTPLMVERLDEIIEQNAEIIGLLTKIANK